MHRAYWAIPRTLKMKNGQQVNIAFGVASMLISMLKIEQPDAWVWCCDRGDETFRHAEHTEYKAGRQETPQDFYDQMAIVDELLAAFGIAIAGNPQYEADDFLCSYSHAAVTAGVPRVTVVTGDRDAFQLATDKIRIAIPHKGYQATEYLGPAEVLTKYGVRPDQVAALKGLAGDSSDNLKGVGGIGPKTAAELLATYGTLEGIYDHLADIRPAVRAKLEADRESAFFCQKMAVLLCDAPLPVPLDQVNIDHQPVEPIVEMFDRLEFMMLRRRFENLLETDYGKRSFQGSVNTPHHQVKAGAASVSSSDAQMNLFE